MNMEQFEYAIAAYGTPLYLFDLDVLSDTAARFRGMLAGSAGLCFAMKANPFLAGELAHLTDRIEVCSAGEFEICKRQGIPPEKLIISGVLKEKKSLSGIMDYCSDRAIYTAESRSQLLLLSEWANANQKRISVYPRLTSGCQFGLDLSDIQELLVHNTDPFVNLCGLHYFSGTQKKSVQKITEELRRLDEILISLEQVTGRRILNLEYGPGLSVPYFKDQTDTWEADVRLIRETIAGMSWKGSVTLEMGRALAARCGCYLTRVMDTKRNNGRNYCIVDGGIHQLHYDGQIRGMYLPMCVQIPDRPAEAPEEWTVCGCLCTTNDVLIQSVPFSGLTEGDILIFHHAGAYSMTEGMALFLSHPLPQLIAYSKENGWWQIRREQQTYHWNYGGKIIWNH